MGAFNNAVITAKGTALLAKVIAGKTKLTFTKIAVGDQKLSGDLAKLTAITIKQNAKVASIVQQNSSNVKVSVSIANNELKAGYYVRSIGLYATDPDDGEILYSVSAADESSATADWMPPYNGIGVSSLLITLVTAVANASTVNLTVDPAAFATAAQIVDLQAQIDDLQGYIGYEEPDIYGIEVDYANKKVTRLAGAYGKTPGADFDDIPCFGGRRRCNVKDNGSVIAYYGDVNYSERGTALQTKELPEVPIASAQVMVEQPVFYYKVVPLQLERIPNAATNTGGGYFHTGYSMKKARYYVSPTPKKGFKVHPAFVVNGVVNDKIYLSAFEGCLQEHSSPDSYRYIMDDAKLSVDYSDSAVKLSSIMMAKPASGMNNTLTRDKVRAYAKQRYNEPRMSTGWSQSTVATVSATQLLMMIEYGTLNLQSALSVGNTARTDDGKTNMAALTGMTSPLGNASGEVEVGEGEYTSQDRITYKVMSYRGEENFYGNIWTWVDGINILNPTPFVDGQYGRVYVADHDFEDNQTGGSYEDTGIYPVFGSGYVSAVGYSEKFDWLFIPTEHKGTNALPVGDYYWNQNTGDRVALLGGYWYSGASAGAFCWFFYSASSSSDRGIGGRLVYVPSKNRITVS